MALRRVPFTRCLFAAAALLAVSTAAPLMQAETLRYAIDPGGRMTYFPSPFTPIDGCQPNSAECEFGVSGSFSVDYDSTTDSAVLLDLDLMLTGNDAVQIAPPVATLTSKLAVEAYLASRQFDDLPTAGPFDTYTDQSHPALVLTSFNNGVSLAGGYDTRAMDGDGVVFILTASVIPEPASLALTAPLALLLLRRRRGLQGC
ncbi:hypothetical protein Mal64_10500 [Pseudobythopirellula maris]|uniref:PEP-CTERM protein-sorting domain-containing protein n=1 Tax=Pseudobythopirellula maris TaxID=2527991 RepID=A0A5C5ZTX6_9BACT|nr:hypothetical protein [Pseudobythopirellula maris]TWT90656.1 hypothetical protein Mal64_10500 [Pseudobythopirellula maris]